MSEKKNYTKEQIRRGEDFTRLITKYPKDKQRILFIAADAFMAGLSAGSAAKEEPELMKREA